MTHARPLRASVLCALVSASGPAALAACTGAPGEPVGSTPAAVVYGVDDRLDYYQSESALFRGITEDAIAVMIDASGNPLASNGDGTFSPDAPTLDQFVGGLCDGERYGDQPTMGSCSATLIDDDLVLTAGHCTAAAADGIPCADAQFVFDYFYVASGQLEEIDADDVYDCAEVVVEEYGVGGEDYAIVRLDRPVVGRTPAPVDVSFDVADGDPVVVVGFPTGLPAQIDDGGEVIDPRTSQRDYFTATTDTFGGNSGSGVFTDDGVVVGILVRGAADYLTPMGETCRRVNVISVGPSFSGGEDITYAANAIEALCAEVGDEGELCEDGEPIGGGGAGGGTAMPGGGAGGGSGGGGCAAAPGTASPVGFVAVLIAAIGLLRRRRATRA